MRADVLRSNSGAAILVGLAADHGMGLAECLRGTGITPVMLERPGAEIRLGQELRLVQNVVRALGHVPGLGLDAGRRYDMTNDGIYSLAVVSSPTIRHAWRMGVKYIDIGLSLANWRFEEAESEAAAVLDDTGLPAEVRTFLLERDIASIAVFDRDVFGTLIAPDAVELACPRPDYVEQFTELLTFAPIFDAPSTRIVMSNGILDLRMPQGNVRVAALAEQQAAAILQSRRARQGIAAQVRAVLLRRGVDSNQDDIAAELRTSVRTLRRRLKLDGTSYREVVSETRQMLAEELLAVGATVEDVAERLGYADASSFTHAFARRKGTSPGRFARSVR
jgi:AraC-like DNA-binding protein